MGGAEALHYMLNHNFKPSRPHFSGLLLASPYVDLDKENAPHWFTVKAGKMAAKMMPNKQLKQAMDAKYMSRNKTVQEDWKNDELCHDMGTLGGLAGMLVSHYPNVFSSLSQTTLPTHLTPPRNDPPTSHPSPMAASSNTTTSTSHVRSGLATATPTK